MASLESVPANSSILFLSQANGKKLKELSTLTVTVSDKSNQLEKLQSMKVQGECFRLGVDMLDNWSVAIYFRYRYHHEVLFECTYLKTPCPIDTTC